VKQVETALIAQRADLLEEVLDRYAGLLGAASAH
jgi:hypothetical protein